jgi:hypothetical protein
VWFIHAECDSIRKVWFVHAECNFYTQYDFNTHECDYNTHDWYFNTCNSDLYTQSVISIRLFSFNQVGFWQIYWPLKIQKMLLSFKFWLVWVQFLHLKQKDKNTLNLFHECSFWKKHCLFTKTRQEICEVSKVPSVYCWAFF